MHSLQFLKEKDLPNETHIGKIFSFLKPYLMCMAAFWRFNSSQPTQRLLKWVLQRFLKYCMPKCCIVPKNWNPQVALKANIFLQITMYMVIEDAKMIYSIYSPKFETPCVALKANIFWQLVLIPFVQELR